MFGAVLSLMFAYIYNIRHFGDLLHFFDQSTAIYTDISFSLILIDYSLLAF
jgi:hypothetical protein